MTSQIVFEKDVINTLRRIRIAVDVVLGTECEPLAVARWVRFHPGIRQARIVPLKNNSERFGSGIEITLDEKMSESTIGQSNKQRSRDTSNYCQRRFGSSNNKLTEFKGLSDAMSNVLVGLDWRVDVGICCMHVRHK
jgi:hypothetical protein